MYWLIVISRRQGGLCIISSPDCIFIVHVKKEKIHVCTLHYWTFCGSGWSTQWTNTVVLSLICAVKDVFSFLVYFHDSSALVRAATNISVIDWFQKRSSEALVYLRSHWGKSNPVFIPALLLMLWFVLTLLCTSKIFFSSFSPLKTKSLVNPRQTIWISSQVVKA